MRLYDFDALDAYMKGDPLLQIMGACALDVDETLTCHKWLAASPAKRMIAWDIYGDLLSATDRRLRVLDVGGGLTSLTRRLAENHDYHLVDVMAHDDADVVEAMLKSIGARVWQGRDWWDFHPEEAYDVVIANDLFPNVDQRLELFVSRLLPQAGEMRLSLTFYPEPRFYPVKRVDADEQMCLLAWDNRQLGAALGPISDRVHGGVNLPSTSYKKSLFSNGRQVALALIDGHG